MARLSTATRHKVIILHQQGLSQAKISKQTGVSRCAVQALLKKHKETGNVDDRRRSGRPRKLSVADERHIMLTSLRNRKMSSTAISSELAVTCGTQVHPSTIRRSLGRKAAVALAAEAGIFSPIADESVDALLKMSISFMDSTAPALSDDSHMTEDETESGLLPAFGAEDMTTGTDMDTREVKDEEDNNVMQEPNVLQGDPESLLGVDPKNEVICNAMGSLASQTGPKP